MRQMHQFKDTTRKRPPPRTSRRDRPEPHCRRPTAAN
jgi:hypothetical protein